MFLGWNPLIGPSCTRKSSKRSFIDFAPRLSCYLQHPVHQSWFPCLKARYQPWQCDPWLRHVSKCFFFDMLLFVSGFCSNSWPRLQSKGYSSKHEAWYHDNASKALFKLMCQAKSRHYQPDVVKAIKDTKKQDDEQIDAEPKKKPRGGGGRSSQKPKRKSRSGKGKGKGRGKGKGSKKRKADNMDEGDEEENFLEEDEEASIIINLFELALLGLVTGNSSCTSQEDEASADGVDDDDEEEDSV